MGRSSLMKPPRARASTRLTVPSESKGEEGEEDEDEVMIPRKKCQWAFIYLGARGPRTSQRASHFSLDSIRLYCGVVIRSS